MPPEAAERRLESLSSLDRYSLYLSAVERHDDAIDHSRRAVDAAPFDSRIRAEYGLRCVSLVFPGAWPVYDLIRSDPRFDDLLRRINYPGTS